MLRKGLWVFTLALLSGCLGLLSGTKVFQFDVVRDGQPNNPGQAISINGGTSGDISIALGDVDVFEKHRDEIKEVDRAGFEGTFENTGGAATSISVYFSESAGLADPASEATLLLNGLNIPAAGRAVSYEDSEALIKNFDQFQKLVRQGDFSLYFTASNGVAVTIPDLVLIVAFTVGL